MYGGVRALVSACLKVNCHRVEKTSKAEWRSVFHTNAVPLNPSMGRRPARPLILLDSLSTNVFPCEVLADQYRHTITTRLITRANHSMNVSIEGDLLTRPITHILSSYDPVTGG